MRRGLDRYRLGVNGLGPLGCKVLIAIPFCGASAHGRTAERFLGFRGTGSAIWHLHDSVFMLKEQESEEGDEKLSSLCRGCVRTYMPIQPASVSGGDMGKECTSVKERERERVREEKCGRERQCNARKGRFGPESA